MNSTILNESAAVLFGTKNTNVLARYAKPPKVPDSLITQKLQFSMFISCQLSIANIQEKKGEQLGKASG